MPAPFCPLSAFGPFHPECDQKTDLAHQCEPGYVGEDIEKCGLHVEELCDLGRFENCL